MKYNETYHYHGIGTYFLLENICHGHYMAYHHKDLPFPKDNNGIIDYMTKISNIMLSYKNRGMC